MNNKALVLNEVLLSYGMAGCKFGCLFKKDSFKETVANKILCEKNLSEKFSEYSKDGFELTEERVFTHKLFVDNIFNHNGSHGVYRYQQTGNSPKYKVYLGPIIKLPPLGKKLGCKAKLGCGSGGGIGCGSKGGDKQFLNFYDNAINEEEVQKLNKHFGFRQGGYDPYTSDYHFSDSGIFAFSELVKQNYDALLEQYKQDVAKIYSEGYGYKRLVDLPAENELFSQALLFSTDDNKKVTFDNKENVGYRITLLHRFDVWYFPKVKGLLRRLLDTVLGWFGKKDDEVEGTSILEDRNIERLEEVYTNDFNTQEIISKIPAENFDKIVSRIPVTIAIEKKRGFWKRIFKNKDYNYFTFLVPAVKE